MINSYSTSKCLQRSPEITASIVTEETKCNQEEVEFAVDQHGDFRYSPMLINGHCVRRLQFRLPYSPHPWSLPHRRGRHLDRSQVGQLTRGIGLRQKSLQVAPQILLTQGDDLGQKSSQVKQQILRTAGAGLEQ